MVHIVVNPRISMVIIVVVVDLPLVYGMLLGRECIKVTWEMINTRMFTITFPYNKDLTICPREGE